MDFIERWFHIAPDGGDGTWELSYLILAAVAVAAVVCRRQILGLIRARKAPGR